MSSSRATSRRWMVFHRETTLHATHARATRPFRPTTVLAAPATGFSVGSRSATAAATRSTATVGWATNSTASGNDRKLTTNSTIADTPTAATSADLKKDTCLNALSKLK